MYSGCSCPELNKLTDRNNDRVGLIADAAPGCSCEEHSLSEKSSGVVQNDETIVRMVCVPLHVHEKKPQLKPNFFNHAFTKGLSSQRLERSGNSELAQWINSFLRVDTDRVWLGYVQAPCDAIRAILHSAEQVRLFCVYDSATDNNPSHVEVCASHRIIEEADRLEARAELRKAFSEVIPRLFLKNGDVFRLVDTDLLERDIPTHWKSFVGSDASNGEEQE